MILIIGGAYQGKLDYITEKYPDKSIFHCTSTKQHIDFSTDIINAFHLFILAQVQNSTDPVDYIQKNLSKLTGKIIICDDISSGVVPIDPEARKWREATGRSLLLLSRNADEVIRVFCGIGSKIK